MNKASIYRSPDSERKIKDLIDAVIAQWPVPCDKLNIATRYGDTFIIASGDIKSPPLILLHGSASNSVTWIVDIVEYSRHFRVYCVDILGEAGKSSPNRLPWNGPGYAEWMEDILNALQIPKSFFQGISLGGWMALKFATYKPERVEKLVLVTPGGIVSAKLSFLLRAFMLSITGSRGTNAISRAVFGKQPVNEDAMRFLKVILDNFKPRVDPQPMFTNEELGLLTMPVLLVIGAMDAVFPSQKIVERMEKHVTGLETKILPNSGHALIGMTSLTVPFLTSK